jgi:ankyrin repeat protein
LAETDLHRAVLRGDVDAATAAISAGAELDALDELGHTALHWAVFGGHEALVELLLVAGANPNVFSADGVTPCWRAVDFGLGGVERLQPLLAEDE